jgi:hypothetical protein
VYLYPLLFFGEREDQKSMSSCLFVDKGFYFILFLKIKFLEIWWWWMMGKIPR